MTVELHAAVRFVRLWREKTGDDFFKEGVLSKLTMVLYNLVWWSPLVLPFTDTISYQQGFILFMVITYVRLTANLIRNNFLTLDQAIRFPLRIP